MIIIDNLFVPISSKEFSIKQIFLNDAVKEKKLKTKERIKVIPKVIS